MSDRNNAGIWTSRGAACAMVLFIAGLGTAQAATYNWTQTTAPSSYDWDTATQNNWGTGIGGLFPNAPLDVANISVEFGGSNALVTINLNGTRTIGSLTLNDTGSYSDAYINIATGSGGSGLVFDNGINPALLTATSSVGVGPPQHVVSANVSLASNLSVFSGNGGGYYNFLTVSGNITETGTRSLTKTGNGNLILSGTNNYTGGTDATAGSVLFANSAALPSSGLLQADSGAYIGANFVVNQTNFIDYFDKANTQGTIGLNASTSNNIDMTGFHANARLGSSGTATYSGTLTPQGDTYRFGGSAGTLTTVPAGVLTISSQLTDAAGPTVRNLNMGSGGVLPAGTVILTNATNSFTGTTTVEAGALQISVDSHLGIAPGSPTPGKIVLTNGTLQSSAANLILDANRGIALGVASGTGTGTLATTGTSLTYNGIIANNTSATGDLIVRAPDNGAGVVILGGTNTYTGFTRVSGGILRAVEGVGLPTTSNLQFNAFTYNHGSALETSGSFTRSLGSGAGQVRWFATSNAESGGFSAFGGPLTVNIGNDGQMLKYNTTFFNPSGLTNSTLTFNSIYSDGILTFVNGIDLNGMNRWFNVGGNSTTAYSEITGKVTNTHATAAGFSTQKGSGLLKLSNDTNDFNGALYFPSTHGGSDFNGTIGFTSIKDVGAGASALGAPTTSVNGTIYLGLGAGIRYLGTDPLGHSTDRIIHLGLRTGGGRVEASGVGKLTMTTSPQSQLAAGNALTLGGTTLGEWAANIGTGIPGISTLTKTDAGTWILSGTNAFTGVTAVNGGSLIAATHAPSGSAGAFGNTTSEVTLGVASGNNNAAILINGAFNVGRNIRLLTSNTTDSGTRELTIGGNTADGSIFSGNIILGTNSQAGRGVTLTAVSGGTTTFSGSIQNPTAMDATTYTVTKSGLGTVVLTGSNTYTGTTAVNAGTLLVNNVAGSGVGTGNVFVNGGTLGGTGTIGLVTDASNVSFGASGGILAPGASAGLLRVYGDVVMNADSTFAVDLDGSVPGVLGGYDQLAILSATGSTNTLNLGSATLALDVAFLPTVGEQFIIVDNQTPGLVMGLFSYNDMLLNNGDEFNVSGHLFQINYDLGPGANDIYLTYNGIAPVPEPSSLALLMLGGLAVSVRRRRNKQQA